MDQRERIDSGISKNFIFRNEIPDFLLILLLMSETINTISNENVNNNKAGYLLPYMVNY